MTETEEVRKKFEEWCPIKIIDEDCRTAPKARALIDAYWTAFEAAYQLGVEAMRQAAAELAADHGTSCGDVLAAAIRNLESK